MEGERKTQDHKERQGPCGLSGTWEPRSGFLLAPQLPVWNPAVHMSIMSWF